MSDGLNSPITSQSRCSRSVNFLDVVTGMSGRRLTGFCGVWPVGFPGGSPIRILCMGVLKGDTSPVRKIRKLMKALQESNSCSLGHRVQWQNPDKQRYLKDIVDTKVYLLDIDYIGLSRKSVDTYLPNLQPHFRRRFGSG